jgi:hypothetical protein
LESDRTATATEALVCINPKKIRYRTKLPADCEGLPRISYFGAAMNSSEALIGRIFDPIERHMSDELQNGTSPISGPLIANEAIVAALPAKSEPRWRARRGS